MSGSLIVDPKTASTERVGPGLMTWRAIDWTPEKSNIQ